MSGGYSYVYDARGQVTSLTQTTTENASYTLQTAYNDAGQPTSVTYSDGEVFTPGYNAFGWLTSAVTVPQGGSQVNLLTAIGYSGVGGAAMHPTSATVGNGTYSYSASYDDDLRLSSASYTRVSDGTTLFGSTRTYDAVGNVATVATTLLAGTDNQVFCYDEQNHLWSAASTGTPPCTGTAITPGTLTSAQYSVTYSYDAMNRLTATALGSYSYGDSAHVHAATGAGSNGSGGPYYSASYDAVGDMTCRAPTSATTCSGTPTGQQMTYDAERRLSHWQRSPSNPTSSADDLYDGSGNRVEQVEAVGSTTTKVYYLLGGVEEVSTTGSTSTLTKYYSAAGLLIGVNVGGTISYLASDGLGSVSEAFDGAGNVTAAQLYGPYGGVRYSSGTMPTSKGYTGQRADAATSGLDYYNARYYDPVLGQFASADSQEGPNRYAYVAGNPETLTDPSGHRRTCAGSDCGGGGGGGGGGSGSGGDGGSGTPPGTCNASCYSHHHHSGGSGFALGDPIQCPPSVVGCPIVGAIGSSGIGSAIGAVGGIISAIAWALADKAVCPSCKTPTQAQVNSAKQVASDTQHAFDDPVDKILTLLAVATLVMAAKGTKCVTCNAAFVALSTVFLDMKAVQYLFQREAEQGNSFWDSPAKLLAFQVVVHAAVITLDAAIAAFESYTEDDFPGGTAGALGGSILGFPVLKITDDAMAQEKEDLGYPL